jgi:hypothetical protein
MRHILLEAPDVSWALLSKWNMAIKYSENPDRKQLLIFPFLQLVSSLRGDRAQVVKSDSKDTGIKVLASKSKDEKNILVWNSGEEQSIRLNFAGSRGTDATLVAIENNVLRESRKLNVSSGLDVKLAKNGIYHLRLASSTRSNSLTNRLSKAVFVRPLFYVNRSADPAVAPQGMGHVDPNSMTLIAAVGNSSISALGTAGAIFRDAPQNNWKLSLDFTRSQPLKPGSFAGVRIDYLDRNNTLKTIIYSNEILKHENFVIQHPRLFTPKLTSGSQVVRRTIEASTFVNGRLNVDISSEAPPSWSTVDNSARRVMISLHVGGDFAGVSTRMQLSDAL